MKQIRNWGPLALAAVLLAACGGGGDDPVIPGSAGPSGAPTTRGAFTSVVSFGDSLSDLGTYAVTTSLAGNGTAPYFGGKFTTNTGPTSAAGTVWVENIATRLGLAITPAEVGYGTSSVKCPAAAASAALANTCTGYGQGGSRVTDPNGNGKASGALTVPVVTQIANHLTRFGNFKSSDLVLVFGGANDVLVQFSAFAATATQVQTDAAAGRLTATQANAALSEAQTLAYVAVRKAALELAAAVSNEIVAKGGRYVAVVNLPDIAKTPLGGSITSASAKAVLTGLSNEFNLWLRTGLDRQPVFLLDINAYFTALAANPSAYGFVNVTVPACDAAKIALITSNRITDGSSIVCNSTPGAPYNGIRTGADATTWAFADAIHPTTGGHRALSDEAVRLLTAAGWL
jgi:phospholipase/lecithinase/hemolysin